MSQPYSGRHRPVGPTRSRRRALPRGPLQAGLALSVLAASAGGYLAADALAAGAPAQSATFDLTARDGVFGTAARADAVQTVERAVDRDGEAVRDQRARTQEAAVTRAVLAAQQAEAARLEAERQAAAERAARDAQRSAVIANAQQNPRAAAQTLVADRGWNASQFQCLDRLWTKESNWSYTVSNRSSGAYGIPQALPGSKMATVAADWRTNPVTQITWGLNYIAAIYGTPCSAWSHSQSYNWY
ncbi:MAG: hypothetical protein V9G08_01485 [Dermatophilaceae bacterium]